MFVRMYVSRAFLQMTEEEQTAHANIEEDILYHFGGYTVLPTTRGVWRDPQGIRHSDVVDVYDIMTPDIMPTPKVRGLMIDFALRFGKVHGQQCIPFTMMGSTNVFNEVNPDPNV